MTKTAKNISTDVTRSMTIGSETPLNRVSTFLNRSSNSLEILARVTYGTTTHRFELCLTEDGAAKLAREIVRELGLTAQQVGL